jgi:hypothetical protein
MIDVCSRIGVRCANILQCGIVDAKDPVQYRKVSLSYVAVDFRFAHHRTVRQCARLRPVFISESKVAQRHPHDSSHLTR